MFFNTLRTLGGAFALCNLIRLVCATSENVTAPMDFIFPTERAWYAAYQTDGPCGTNATVGKRTDFPISSGLLSVVIADEAYNVTFQISYTNNPTAQSDFSELLSISSVEAGHQCYNAKNIPSTIPSNTNATIQLKYTSQYGDSSNETFYACADIRFVTDSLFTDTVECLNVTIPGASSDGLATSAATSSSAAATASSTASSDSSSSSESSKSSHGLSGGAKAGIAVGCVVGGLAIISVLAFVLIRRHARRNRTKYGDEGMNLPRMKRLDDSSSITSEVMITKQ